MDADLLELDTGGASKDGSQSQGVYIYRPADKIKSSGERPTKRRKVARTDLPKAANSRPFVSLLNGDEDAKSIELRYRIYHKFWAAQEAKIKGILDDVDSEVLTNVLSFVRSTSPQTYDGCIPAALVTVGSNVSSLGRLLSRLNGQLTATGEGGVIALESGDAPNLKTTLKNIIRFGITNTEGNEGYQSFVTDREGPRVLGYDLDLLADYVKRKEVKKLVLAFRDSEAFDPGILADLLSLLSSWLDRIPLTLIFGISTSVELFEGRLPRSTVALLRGRYFEIHEASNCVDRIYGRIQAEQDGKFWLGRNITSVLFEKSSDSFQTPEAFSRTVKYAYMSHFFANPLSVLLADDDAATTIQRDKVCEALRNLPSFRRYCEDTMEEGCAEQVRKLLEDDAFLLEQSAQWVKSGQQKMRDMFKCVDMVQRALKKFNIVKKTSISDLAIRALAGELQTSASYEDILRAIKTLDSDQMPLFAMMLPDTLTASSDFAQIQADFGALLQVYQGTEPLKSGYDKQHSVVATTVVQQRVKLSKAKVKLPKENAEFTKIIDRFHALLEACLEETLIRPNDLVLHEIFLLDMRNPLKEVFSPRPRFAVERALSSPFDYLISSPESSTVKVSAHQPAAAILYQLYLESGSLVNVHDLWQAFYAVFESEQGNGCDERTAMALFYRALSDLKALGMMKSSRKKVDHVSKTAWMGL